MSKRSDQVQAYQENNQSGSQVTLAALSSDLSEDLETDTVERLTARIVGLLELVGFTADERE